MTERVLFGPGGATEAKQDTIITAIGDVETAVQALEQNPLTDTQLRATPVPISATNLDVRDLAFATDKVDVSGSTVTVNEPVSIDDNGGSLTVDGDVGEAAITTGTNSSVAGTTSSSTTLLSANASRRGATIFNDDTVVTGATLFVSLGATCTTTNFTISLAPQAFFNLPVRYTGIITGVWSAATGNARLTELT